MTTPPKTTTRMAMAIGSFDRLGRTGSVEATGRDDTAGTDFESGDTYAGPVAFEFRTVVGAPIAGVEPSALVVASTGCPVGWPHLRQNLIAGPISLPHFSQAFLGIITSKNTSAAKRAATLFTGTN